ncbi:hypothetical protein DOY81_004570, partial [Sarcophaga bullata]
KKINFNLPVIEMENFKLQRLDKQRYQLSLTIPNSELTEYISLDPQESHVIIEGTLTTFYPDKVANLIVNYVADSKGYRASFKFSSQPQVTSFAPQFETRLSGSDLKSLAG